MNSRPYEVSHPPLIRRDTAIVIASGFLATLAMTTIMYVVPLVGMGQVDAPLWTARLFVTDPTLAAVAGLILHLFVGFAFAWLYAKRVEPKLNLQPASAGLLFGVVLWIFAQAVAVPALGALADLVHGGGSVSPGFLAVRLGADGAFASLAAHLAYGAVLGSVYGCLARGLCLGRDKCS